MTSTSSRRRRGPGPAIAVVLLAAAAPATAQTGVGDARTLAAGGDLPVGAADRSEGAGWGPASSIPANPAGLAGGTGWRFAITPVHLDLSLGPVTGRDLARAGDGVLSRERREAWLDRVGEGEQRGRVDVTVGPIRVRRGNVALEVSTAVAGRTRLPADAVELLLFGNAGRDGEAGDFRLAGSALDGAVWTRVGLGIGLHPAPSDRPELAVGARLHATVGHALVVTRDAGSVAEGADAILRLPSISTAGGDVAPGFGVGLDLGVTWDGAGGRTGIVLHDAVSGFEWFASALRYRAGETLIRGEGIRSDFDPRPVSEAPATLRALARRVRPARRVEVEHVRRIGEALRLRLVVRERIERGTTVRRDARLAGIEWRAGRRLDIAAHVGAVDGDARLGAGATLALGAWKLSAAWAVTRGDDRSGSALAVSIGR